jgi:nicotinamidase-related amidase
MNAIVQNREVDTAAEVAAILAGLDRVNPLGMASFDAAGRKVGLVVVDEVVGFVDVGAGPMAPAASSPQIERMVDETDRLARAFIAKARADGDGARRVMIVREDHTPGMDEAPYPAHCERGTGHELMTAKLRWTDGNPDTLVVLKECINAAVGGIRPDGSNAFFDGIKAMGVDALVFVGICTDICLMGPVLACLSARTLGLLGGVKDIVVYEPGCASYDLPLEAARAIGFPDTAAHPGALYHAMGLRMMQSQGVVVAGEIAGLPTG